jgi:hypothetical protein
MAKIPSQTEQLRQERKQKHGKKRLYISTNEQPSPIPGLKVKEGTNIHVIIPGNSSNNSNSSNNNN